MPSPLHSGCRLCIRCPSQTQPRVPGPLREIPRASHSEIQASRPPNTGEPLIRIVGTPGTQNAYIYFNVGEGPMLSYNLDYFMRFESKLVNRDNVMPYLKEVYLIARQYFPDNVQFWVSGESPALIRVLDRIPNIREQEGPPQVGEEWYKVRARLSRLGREQEQGTKDEKGVKSVDSPDG